MLLDETGLPWIWGWWPGTELNRRHKDFQSSALPTELPGPVLRGCCLNWWDLDFARRCGWTKGRYLNLKTVLRQGSSAFSKRDFAPRRICAGSG